MSYTDFPQKSAPKSQPSEARIFQENLPKIQKKEKREEN